MGVEFEVGAVSCREFGSNDSSEFVRKLCDGGIDAYQSEARDAGKREGTVTVEFVEVSQRCKTRPK